MTALLFGHTGWWGKTEKLEVNKPMKMQLSHTGEGWECLVLSQVSPGAVGWSSLTVLAGIQQLQN